MVDKHYKTIEKAMHKSVAKIKNGYSISLKKNEGSYPLIIELFGCHACSWRDTELCPHGIKIGELHANRICGDYARYIQKEFDKCGSAVRLIQQEELFKMRYMADRMMKEYVDSGDISTELSKFHKNIISLTDKMRRQDEGIKVQGDISVAVKDFRDLIDKQAEALEGKSILDAEFKYADKPDNGTGQDKSSEKV